MDDQGLRTAARGLDVGAEALALPRQIASLPIVVEPRLPDRDDSGMCRQLCEPIGRWFRAPVVVRMYSDGCIDVRKPLCDRQHFGKGFETHTHAQRVSYTCRPHPGDHTFQVASQLGEIDVAVRINQHGPAANPYRSERVCSTI